MPDDLPELDPVIHGRLRLALLSLLLGAEEADFTWLRKKTGATDGNLSVQMLKLEVAGYVAMEKRFVGRKPQTLSHDGQRTRGAGEVFSRNQQSTDRSFVALPAGPV